MSRTTTALKRLGVPGLAAATMVAGLPLLLGSASAAHITGLSLTPASDQDAAGVCIPYTAKITFASAAQAVAETVDVTLTDTSSTDALKAAQDVDFCTAAFGGLQPATPADQQDGGAAGSDHAEFTTTVSGNTASVTFGIVSNQQGGAVTIRAFYEASDNDTFDAGEFTDVKTQTFTTGGPAGSNVNQDAADTVEVIDRTAAATATVTADTTDSDSAIEGETRTYRVAVLNASGDRLAGVSVNYKLDAAGDGTDVGSAAFGTTDNNGIATGTITFPSRTGTANTTDVVTFFVNQSTGVTAGPEAGEPQDTLTVTVRDAGTQANRTVTLTPDSRTQNASQQSATFTAVVDDPRTTGADSDTTGTFLSFSVSGGSGDEKVTATPATAGGSANECTTGAYAVGTDPNDSACTVTVNDPTPTVGQTLTITATVRGASASDTATLTFTNAPGDARFVALTPETVTVQPNTAQQLQAKVTDVDGNPVANVTVTFTESGAGAFRNGSSSTTGVTNAQGVATVETLSLPGETGQQTVTATIDANSTQCSQAANKGTDPQGNQLNGTDNKGAAGVCTDSSTVTYSAASPTPSTTATATPTATQSPTTPPTSTPPGAVDCTRTPQVVLERSTIIATGRAPYTLSNVTPNSVVEIYAYSRPSTTYKVVRRITINSDGAAPSGDGFVPPTNTRLYAQIVGCDTDESRFSVVLNVRTQISLNVERNGTRDYTFSGRLLPARPGGLIASLYRVTNDGRQILTDQARANASTGVYVMNRKFTGTGRFGFIVRTGQDLQNAPGASNVRSLLVF